MKSCIKCIIFQFDVLLKYKVTEVKNSYWLEIEGLKRCLEFLEGKLMKIKTLVTDRHAQVKKFLRTTKDYILHWFDVWHVAKGIQYNLQYISSHSFNLNGKSD